MGPSLKLFLAFLLVLLTASAVPVEANSIDRRIANDAMQWFVEQTTQSATEQKALLVCEDIWPGPNPFAGEMEELESGNICNGGRCGSNDFVPHPSPQLTWPADFSGNVFNHSQVTNNTYQYQSWNERENYTLTFVGNGTAVIYITDDVKINKNASINWQGLPANLLIVHTGDEFKLDVDAKFKGFVYSTGEITIEERAQFYGAISSTDDEFVVKKDGEYYYQVEDLQNFNPHGFCQSSTGTGDTLHHIQIEHQSNASTCWAEQITLKACATANCDSLYRQTVDVDFQVNGINKQRATLNGGLTTLNFSHGQIGSAQLSIANPSETPEQSYACQSGASSDCAIVFSDATCLSCNLGWQDGATSWGDNNDAIQFAKDTQIVNNPDNILASLTVKVDDKSSVLSCEDQHCQAAGNAVSQPLLGAFLFSDNKNNVTVEKGARQTLGDDGINHFNEVTLEQGSNVSFSDGFSEYRIDTLSIEKNVTLNLPAGDYWINELDSKGSASEDQQGFTLNVIGGGQARLFFTGTAEFHDRNRINVSGDPQNLWLISYGNLKIKKQSFINAMIYAQQDVEIENESILTGAVSAEKIKIEQESQIIYGCSYVPPTELPVDICTDIFVDGATSHNENGEVRFDLYGVVEGNDDTELMSPSVINPDTWLGNLTCETVPCSASGEPTKALWLGDFKTTNSNLVRVFTGDAVIGADNINEFAKIDIKDNAKIKFSSAFNQYFIGDITFGSDSEVTLSGGDYWLENAVFADNVVLNLEGSARLFFANSVIFTEGLEMNVGGVPEDLLVYGYQDITTLPAPLLTPYKNVEAAALIYARGDIELGAASVITGAVSADKLNVSVASSIVYQCTLNKDPLPQPPDLQCSSPFVDGATSFNTSSDNNHANIEIAQGARIINNPDTVLAATTVSSDDNTLSCFAPAGDQALTAACSASGKAVEPLSIEPFPSEFAATDIVVREGQTYTITSGQDFDYVKVEKQATLIFTIAANDYTLAKLELDDQANVVFAPGTYWINDVETDGEEHVFSVNGDGVVNLNVNGHVDIRDGSVFNQGGKVGNMMITAYDRFHVKKNVTINALVYAVSDFHIESGSVLNGAVSSAKVDLRENATIEFSCLQVVAPAPTYQIIHDGNGLTCESEGVLIRACSDNTCTATNTSINDTVTLAVDNERFVDVDIVNGVSRNAQFQHVVAEPALLSIVGQDYRCINSADPNLNEPFSCYVSFADAGFVIEVSDIESCQAQDVLIRAVKKDDATKQCVGALTGSKAINLNVQFNTANNSNTLP